jgi:hypothetical protein
MWPFHFLGLGGMEVFACSWNWPSQVDIDEVLEHLCLDGLRILFVTKPATLDTNKGECPQHEPWVLRHTCILPYYDSSPSSKNSSFHLLLFLLNLFSTGGPFGLKRSWIWGVSFVINYYCPDCLR